jgi:hypothetical protein
MLNSTAQVDTTTPIPSHITKSQVLSFLHDDAKMLALNLLMSECKTLPPDNSAKFYKTVPSKHQPANVSSCKVRPSSPKPFLKSSNVTIHTKLKPKLKANMHSTQTYFITEDSDAREASSGSWTKKFVPEKVQYETGVENTPTGMVSITHAPLGVSSVTTWVVKEKDGACVVDMTGKVESNMVLMQFIKRMLAADYQELADRFLETLKKEVEGGVEKV